MNSVVICAAGDFKGPDGVPVVASVEAAGPADVIVIDAGVAVPDGWLEALLAARVTDGTVATISAVTADAAACAQRPPLHPRVLTPTWACTLVTHAALRALRAARRWLRGAGERRRPAAPARGRRHRRSPHAMTRRTTRSRRAVPAGAPASAS